MIFQVVLGLEFMNQVKVVPMSFISSVVIMEGPTPCTVPTVPRKSLGKSLLFAMQLKKGLKCRQPTYLVALLEDHPEKQKPELPRVIERVLESFSDVMPKSLPQKLPSWREVDHQIELELGGKASTFSPY